MAITVKHNKVSTIPDGDDTSVVRPSDWNADHTLVGLGTMAEQNSNNVNITGGSITGVTGLGDVTGPASATDNAIARFDQTTGKLIQNSVVTVSDTGGIAGATTITDINYVDFNTAYNTTLATGQLGWNGNDTLGVGMSGGNIVQEIGLQNFIYGKASSAITKGQLIKKTGANGSSGVITFAPTTANMTNSTDIIGIAAENIALNGFGYIMSTGNLRGFNTTGSSSGETWADGDTLYYNPTGNGLMTKTKPSAPNSKTEVAVVTNAGSGGSGSVVVEIIHGSQLGGTDSNVQLTSPTTGQTLVYDQPTGIWNNSNAPTISGGSINNTPIGATTPSTGTFTAVDIATTGTDAQLAPNTGITGWNYSGKSFSIAAEESNPTGLFFSPDGLNMYVNGSTGDDVNQYTLSTAWNVSTATYVRVFSTAAQDTSPQDVFFKPDGLTMYVVGSTNDTVFQYTLSSAWNISTASYASKSFSVTSQETNPTGLWFKSDGTVMYVIGTTNDTVFQYNLGTAWDVSTASYASISFDINSQEGTPSQVNLSADGLTMWILGSTGDDISQYSLGTAWNVSTATFVNNLYIGFQEITSSGLFIDSTADNRVYMVGQTNDTVYQYNTATNSISAVTDVFNTTSNARVQGNLAVQSNAYVDGTFAVQGTATFGGASTFGSTLTASSTITLQGTTTSTIALGTSVTSGTITVGGTSGTGTITLGRSTVGQTTDIQAGATASGSTKTINIGTAGLSGSTTNIAIGSSVSGATSRTTLNGIVIDSISASVSAAGTTQGTGTALVSNINNITTVAASSGVVLPTAVAGMRILIRNTGANTLNIYPATGGTINALAANAAFTLTAGSTTELMATTTTQWYTF